MRDFHAIVKELKCYLLKDKNNKIYDKDVARALGISQMNFATLKRRNSIPYEYIIRYCKKEGLCGSELFFD